MLNDATTREGDWNSVDAVSLDFLWCNLGVFDFREKPVSI